MKILFLHGWQSTPGGIKPTYLKDHGHEVLNPALPDDDFAAAVRIAQAAFDRGKPDVVVGSSRGGAVAMNLKIDAPLVVLCPAWKRWGTATTVKPSTLILHSRADDVVPFADSEELVRNSGLPSGSLIEVGTGHRLADPESLAKMLEAVEKVYHDLQPTKMPEVKEASQMNITVANCDWKGANPDDVGAVLESAGNILAMAMAAEHPPLLVERWDKSYAQTDYDLDSAGRRAIHLNTGGWYWGQYAYQFSHELCHVFANFDRNRSKTHKWLEESICETASLYALRGMAEAWRVNPPYPNWRSWGANLRDYADGQMKDLPADVSFQAWLKEELPSLESDQYQRDKNSVVAGRLLPLFEQDDGRAWRAVHCMNLWPVTDDVDMCSYFRNWCTASGQELAQTVSRIGDALGFQASG